MKRTDGSLCPAFGSNDRGSAPVEEPEFAGANAAPDFALFLPIGSSGGRSAERTSKTVKSKSAATEMEIAGESMRFLFARCSLGSIGFPPHECAATLDSERPFGKEDVSQKIRGGLWVMSLYGLKYAWVDGGRHGLLGLPHT
jgi:hypothetical protein